jgi:hypothetical protein
MAWLIRLYDQTGRLLYIASTTMPRPARRIRLLQGEPWWGLVDQTKILHDQPEGNLQAELHRAIKQERPKFYRPPGTTREPYLRARPDGSDYARRLLANGPLSRINRRRAE